MGSAPGLRGTREGMMCRYLLAVLVGLLALLAMSDDSLETQGLPAQASNNLVANVVAKSVLGETRGSSPQLLKKLTRCLMNAAPKCPGGDAAETGWEPYDVVSSKYQRKTFKGKVNPYGAARLFNSFNVRRWQRNAELAFNKEPWWWIKGRKRGLHATMKRYSNHSECLQHHEELIKSLGNCGMLLGGNPKTWANYGCPYMGKKHAPCPGTFLNASHFPLKYRNPDAYSKSITATAQYCSQAEIEIGTSNCTAMGGSKESPPSFFTVTNRGTGFDGKSKCVMQFAMRLGTCRGCCCKDGLVKYEVRTKDLSRNQDNNGIACADWFITSATAASNFFSTWRLAESAVIARKCMGKLGKCRSKAKAA